MNKKILTQIYVYPVKSLGGISLKEAKIGDRGPQFDRRWMLVDSGGNFITQRIYPEMALINVSLCDDGKLTISHKVKTVEPLGIPVDSCLEESLTVKVWGDTLKARAVSLEADEWFSSVLARECRLVYMPDDTQRKVDLNYAHSNEIVGFADAYPFLIVGEESLTDLNSRLKEKVPMNRFRPNFVFSGGEAFEEDKWRHFRIGATIFNVVKPCSRCVMITTDQETSQRASEPLATLAAYRSVNGKVMFGQNLTHELNPLQSESVVRIGDELEIID